MTSPILVTAGEAAQMRAPEAMEHPDLSLPAVLDLPQAAAMLGVGRTTAYKLVHEDRWPTPVLRLGRLIKVPTKPLLDLLAGRAARSEIAPPASANAVSSR
jgi:predicted DNA-binding transcriptional regulator AlpA